MKSVQKENFTMNCQMTKMKLLYDSPKYYEIAFSFRGIEAEVNIFEQAIKQFSKISVKKVLEIGCGNSPHVEELLKRGYEYTGIDLSETMLEYSSKKVQASRMGHFRKSFKLIQADMTNFSLDTKVDFAYIMLGSLYVKNNNELVSHFDLVSNVLKKGGLYFLDWCVKFYPMPERTDTWDMAEDGIKVKVTTSDRIVNRVGQIVEEKIALEVNDKGKNKKVIQIGRIRFIFPQEFLLFIF